MEQIPTWLFQLLGVVGSVFGAWVAVKVSLTRLEVHMTDTMRRVDRHARKLAVHNDDLLTHDFELGTAFSKLQIPRAVRQRLRERVGADE